jgi:predicted LPLAT superfamily acyltransferase
MPVEQQIEWQGKTQGGRLGQKGLFWLFRWIDVRFGYFLLIFIIPFYLIFSRLGFNAIYNYARNILKRNPLHSLILVIRNHYLFGQALLDRFSIFAGNKDSYKVEIFGNESFLEHLEKKDGAIIASAHVGNFEIAGYLLNQKSKKLRPVVYKNEAAVYKQLREKNLVGNNIEMIEIDENLDYIFQIYTALKQGDMISMPCDRFYKGMKNTRVKFLGKSTIFPTGAFHLAVQFNVPVFTIFVMKERSRRYSVFVKELFPLPGNDISKEARVGQLLDEYIVQLESIVNKYPAQWYNYFEFWKGKDKVNE